MLPPPQPIPRSRLSLPPPGRQVCSAYLNAASIRFQRATPLILYLCDLFVFVHRSGAC